ncbi:MAG: adenylate kinase family protein [Candidatus Woesearchaeota archaeon]|nr:adenylate kinase family protein [Candidatus Woesearchaeota archaeon]
MAIIVSGTPGTGKTTFAKKLAKENGLEYIDVNKIIEEHGLSEGLDKDRDAKIIDVKRLNKVLIEIIKKDNDIVIDSHLSHYLSKKYVDVCYITKCSLKELKRRLEERGYSKEKVRENLDAEILDVCRIEAEEEGHKVKIIYTD